ADRLLCVLPFYHMNALMITGWAPIVAGATTVVAPLFSAATAKSYWATVAEYGVTICSVTPSIMSALLKLAEQDPPGPLPATLRLIFCGAGRRRTDLWKRCQDFVSVPVQHGDGLKDGTRCVTMSSPLRPCTDEL